MSAKIFNNNIYSFRKVPWHGLGIVSETPQTPIQIFQQLEPVRFELWHYGFFSPDPEVPGIQIENKMAIVRRPTPSDPCYRYLGMVSEKYELIQPIEIVKALEKYKRPVETAGYLFDGSVLFFSFDLGEFYIKKDKVKTYFLVAEDFRPGKSLKVLLSPIRVVCYNTLILAENEAVLGEAIQHDEAVREKFSIWLDYVFNDIDRKVKRTKELFNQLSDVTIKFDEAEYLVSKIIPEPEPPNPEFPEAIYVREARLYQEKINKTDRMREDILGLYQAGTGMDSQACFSTAYGLFNAVAEFADWVNYTEKRAEGSLYRSLFGWRADLKKRAGEIIYEYVTTK